MYQSALYNYIETYHYPSLALKAVLFDMDGVLFDSMPNHATAWHTAALKYGLHLSKEEAYLHEGRTGASTIDLVCRQQWGRGATEEEIRNIYAEKTSEFNRQPEVKRMKGAREVLNAIKQYGLFPMIVTGSGQQALLSKLNANFPGVFEPELMVTAFDVKQGKPHPEPYLKALEKGKLKANEAIVIENAPLGVQAATAAGIFTVAVNTGPLPDEVLTDAGADLLFPSMQAFGEAWEELYKAVSDVRL